MATEGDLGKRLVGEKSWIYFIIEQVKRSCVEFKRPDPPKSPLKRGTMIEFWGSLSISFVNGYCA
jgi:hypothetical protein